MINDILASGEWQLEHQWHWKSASHINVLESLSYVSLLKKLAASNLHPALRFNALLDSRVAKGAHAKGRSTSQRSNFCWGRPLSFIRVRPYPSKHS